MVSCKFLDIVPLSMLGLMLLWGVFSSEGWRSGQSIILFLLGATVPVSLSFVLWKAIGVIIANHRKA